MSEATAQTTVEVTSPGDTPTGDQEISGLAATNSSPTRFGEATNFAATVDTGTNVVYAWDFGDGTIGNGANVRHTYGQPGVYTARVQAANGANLQEATTEVIVEEEPGDDNDGSGNGDEQIYLPVVAR